MSDIFLCCLSILLISDTTVPDPAAILFFVEPLIIFGFCLSYLVIEKMIGEDDEKRAETQIQGLTDHSVAKIDALVEEKEAEVMEV